MAAGNSMFNNKDSMDINELASLNEDISDDLIEKLSQQITQNAGGLIKPDVNDDSTLFEEPGQEAAQGAEGEEKPEAESKKETISVNTNFDDNFIKKYKAKLNKRAMQEASGASADATTAAGTGEAGAGIDSNSPENQIEKVSQGNISEKPITKEQRDYNDSLDYLDGNVKYSKYVIYIDPQNVEFIDGLTVKERKNLINNILRQQDDIGHTKRKFKVIQTIIMHVIIAIITITLAIPVIYWMINASLEASINNYRRSQTNFQTLYREKGKITNKN